MKNLLISILAAVTAMSVMSCNGNGKKLLPNVSGRLLMSYVDKAKTHKVKDFNTTVNWETDETKDASIIYSYKLDEFRGIVFNTADDNTPNTVKYAIARIGDVFFCFVNELFSIFNSCNSFKLSIVNTFTYMKHSEPIVNSLSFVNREKSNVVYSLVLME